MNRVSTQPLPARTLTGLRVTKRDFMSDWRRWSAVERSVAMAAAFVILTTPLIASAVLQFGT